MRKLLIAFAAAGLLASATACTNAAPPATHAKAHAAADGVITSMASTQSFDTGRSCKHTPAQAECATVWTIAYRDKAGTHTVTVTESTYNRCLRGFPGAHYPACAKRGRS
jgi:hypothetical protein